jgi:hypothetical protein
MGRSASRFRAILLTFFLARAEYRRTKREEKGKKSAEIDFMIDTINAFEDLIQTYEKLDQDSEEARSFHVHNIDPEWLSRQIWRPFR